MKLETAETDAFKPGTLQFPKVSTKAKTRTSSNKTLASTLVVTPLRQDIVEMETRNISYAAEILGSICTKRQRTKMKVLKFEISFLAFWYQMDSKFSGA